MVNKKAYLKTLEAVIAAMILLIFIGEVLPHKTEDVALTPPDIETMQQTILKSISSREDLRTCVLAEDNSCITGFIDGIMKQDLSYEITITDAASSLELPANLPQDKAIYTKTLVISATTADYDPKLVRLHVWRNFE
ncbi:hypothetical protein HYT51_00075 [Candidatus Woesearchaeota archaeon]|nr:hypothetical protein [Candidatus Woesearchaeota archaeon]